MSQLLVKNETLSEHSTDSISFSPMTSGVVLLQTGRHWLTFSNLLRVVETHEPGDIMEALREIDDAVSTQGLYAAGFMSYEAAAAFDLAVHHSNRDDLPLLWFGLYEQQKTNDFEAFPSTGDKEYQLGQWQANFEQGSYVEAVAAIKEHIARGDTYQVNFTMHLDTQFKGDPWAFFCSLVQAQQSDYSAYLNLGRHVICSASPELFFTLNGQRLMARPMKGTARRGHTSQEDRGLIADLQTSVKDRAENVMIVDMIRNDFGRIADIGSVQVPQLFTIEKYPTLLQMTSTVTADSGSSLPQIMKAVFPCASITGAPKVRTMQIINALETRPRGLYTGCIGYMAPGRQAQFNVAIRTVVIDRETGVAGYGVGSGIVWDSDPLAEYEECRLKSKVLNRNWPSFDLFESLLWTPVEGYFLLEKHLERIANSAEYFGFPVNKEELRKELIDFSRPLTKPCKVRLLLDRFGNYKSQAVSLGDDSNVGSVTVGLAAEAVDADDIWLYHKTTHRQLYERAYASRPDCDEVILWNERGELTEATNSNIVLDLDGRLLTPPISSGLLGGTFRQLLLEQGQIAEGVLTIKDLRNCRQIYLINSVRRWRAANLLTMELQRT
ncbi:MAG: aminodeoxychorismate synthase component I [Candidatus Promineifilaceae bacterium]|nr:aminodeoxychorismate synthase component I [Candidatus Promineifilaceae bacterium]